MKLLLAFLFTYSICLLSLTASELPLFVVRKVHVRHFDVISTFFRCLNVSCCVGCAHLLVLVR